MLVQRLYVSIIMIPLLILFAWVGGWIFAGVIAVVLGVAAWEYWHMFIQGGYQPSRLLLVSGTVLLVLARYAFSFSGSDLLISLLVLLAMAGQVAAFERGNTTSALDFNVVVGGVLYLGWLGGYLISVRQLPDGLWWILLVIPAAGMSDAGGYFIGRSYGKHKISRRVSPKKSWEGYIGGIIAAGLGTMLLAALWHMVAPEISAVKGLILGLVIGATALIGDLGESMLKRGVGVKDAGHFLPGHGGIMDRIDSWLWAAPVGFYLILWLWT